MTSDTDREAFEKFHGVYRPERFRSGYGGYTDAYLDREWLVWLAARDHYTAKLRELAGIVTENKLRMMQQGIGPDPIETEMFELAAAILNEREQDDDTSRSN